ncbi:taste receptor type 2 member 7-like [Perognathus longimembris pacificus]|uniref:taste receptor type 2 member 7-like n=1 Tax=Perognathus longimembris pacificus TaxID=214514 RepID=UPI002019259D|nr:taste receptor type 2 member 7-like [Perognathus longimembris pacificus]
MAFPLSTILHMTLMSAEFFIGMMVNGYLIIVNCIDLSKSRKLKPMEILLLCIGISRFGLQLMLMVQIFYSVFFPRAYDKNIYNESMMFIWMLFSAISFWFATCLTLFYCFKISGFTHPSFLWLKFRISKFMLWLLLGSLLASLGTASISTMVELPKTVYDDVFGNTTLKKITANTKESHDLLLVNLTLLLPLAIFVVCTSMLSISLYKHTHLMQSGPHGFSNVKTKAHINALRTIITFVCFFISYFAAFMANMTFRIPYRSHQFFVVKEIMAAFPAGHSLILILSNSKLQQPFRRILCFRKNQ